MNVLEGGFIFGQTEMPARKRPSQIEALGDTAFVTGERGNWDVSMFVRIADCTVLVSVRPFRLHGQDMSISKRDDARELQFLTQQHLASGRPIFLAFNNKIFGGGTRPFPNRDWVTLETNPADFNGTFKSPKEIKFHERNGMRKAASV
jgi:hypothetical protein